MKGVSGLQHGMKIYFQPTFVSLMLTEGMMGYEGRFGDAYTIVKRKDGVFFAVEIDHSGDTHSIEIVDDTVWFHTRKEACSAAIELKRINVHHELAKIKIAEQFLAEMPEE
jgi:hypothetical protein